MTPDPPVLRQLKMWEEQCRRSAERKEQQNFNRLVNRLWEREELVTLMDTE